MTKTNNNSQIIILKSKVFPQLKIIKINLNKLPHKLIIEWQIILIIINNNYSKLVFFFGMSIKG